MTIEQFDQILGYLITVVLPPSVSDDPPVIAEQVIEVLEDHLDGIRGTIIRHKLDEPLDRETA